MSDSCYNTVARHRLLPLCTPSGHSLKVTLVDDAWAKSTLQPDDINVGKDGDEEGDEMAKKHGDKWTEVGLTGALHGASS